VTSVATLACSSDADAPAGPAVSAPVVIGPDGLPLPQVTGPTEPPEPPGELEMACGVTPDAARRLNRVELNNMALEVFGVDGEPFARLPADKNSKFSHELTTGDDFVVKYGKAAKAIAAQHVAAKDPAASCAAPDVACAKAYLEPLALHATRRPWTAERIASLMKVVQTGLDLKLTFQESVAGAIEGILLSPDALYVGINVPQTPGVHRLDGYEVATRLSLALWDSVPDQALLDAASQGQLDSLPGILTQAERMFADPVKGQRFVDSFVRRFAALEALEAISAEPPKDFEAPDQWAALTQAMSTETVMFMRRMFTENLPLQELVSGKWTFLNEQLANHYGMPGVVTGEQHQLVQIPADSPRAGWLTQGSLVVQFKERIHRGKNIVNKFLCEEIPSPPSQGPIVDAVIKQLEAASNGTNSQAELAAIRETDPVCNACHQLMDPLGKGFEAFNPSGQYRPTDKNGAPVDAVSLYRGTALDGPQSVIALVDSAEFTAACIAGQVIGQVTQRNLNLYSQTDADACGVKLAIKDLGAKPGFRDVVLRALASDLFASRVVPSEPIAAPAPAAP
jgi:hypothetical protein